MRQNRVVVATATSAEKNLCSPFCARPSAQKGPSTPKALSCSIPNPSVSVRWFDTLGPTCAAPCAKKSTRQHAQEVSRCAPQSWYSARFGVPVPISSAGACRASLRQKSQDCRVQAPCALIDNRSLTLARTQQTAVGAAGGLCGFLFLRFVLCLLRVLTHAGR